VIAAVANVLIVGGLYLGFVSDFDGTTRAVFSEWGAAYAAGDYGAALGALSDGAARLNEQLADATGVGGLAIGYSATFLIELVLLLIILRRRWGSVDEQRLLGTAARALGAAAVMGAAVLGADAVFGALGWHEAGVALTGLRVLGLAGVGAVTFAVAGVLFGLQEIRTLPAMVLRRRRPSLVADG